MPTIEATCPDCGGKVDIAFGGRCYHGELIWSASHRCRDCSYALEADSREFIPEEYRERELQLNGTWAIQLPRESYSTVAVLKVIRHCCRMSLDQIADLKNHLTTPILDGTQAEMQVVAQQLEDVGIQARIVRVL